MDGDRELTWRSIGAELNEMAKASVSAVLGMFRHFWVLLVVVLMTGWLSYETLRGLAQGADYSDLAALVFPLQLDIAAIPAYQIAADRRRPGGQRVFAALIGLLILAGSTYGNLAAHFGWLHTTATTAFVSVVPPVVCAITLVLWHLPRAKKVAARVVGRVSLAHRSVEAPNPPETSSVETEVTPRPELHTVPSVGAAARIPEGPWGDGSTSIRAFITAFWDLNDREPTSAEVYEHMPSKVRQQRNAPGHIRDIRKQREATA